MYPQKKNGTVAIGEEPNLVKERLWEEPKTESGVITLMFKYINPSLYYFIYRALQGRREQ